jgi:hypothetical protein
MTSRRLLGDTLLDVMLGAAVASSGLSREQEPVASGFSPTLLLQSVEMTLPIEVSLRRRAGTWEVLGDVPRTVTRTPFDRAPGRLEVVWIPGGRP